MRKKKTFLSERQAIEVRALFRYTNKSQRNLALIMGVSQSAISNCIHKHTYRDDASYEPPTKKQTLDKKLVSELYAQKMTYQQITEEINRRCGTKFCRAYIGQTCRKLRSKDCK